jgi:hypothetical protein
MIGRRTYLKVLFALTLATFSCAGCASSAGGPEYAELGLSAASRSSPPTDVGCVRLPTLLGSRTLTQYIIDEQFDLVVFASRESAEVRFETAGSELAPSVLVQRADLFEGYSAEVGLRTSSGTEYNVSLSSECTR